MTRPGAAGSGSWALSVLDPTVTAMVASLVVDAEGGLHVSYSIAPSVSRSALKYAYRAPGKEWLTTAIDESSDSGLYNALAVDATGAVHVAYSYHPTLTFNDYDLRYAYYSP